MLTKEECLKSLCRIQCGARRDKKCEDCECFDNKVNIWKCVENTQESIVLRKLIEEYFDPQPYKFEELHKNMYVWVHWFKEDPIKGHPVWIEGTDYNDKGERVVYYVWNDSSGTYAYDAFIFYPLTIALKIPKPIELTRFERDFLRAFYYDYKGINVPDSRLMDLDLFMELKALGYYKNVDMKMTVRDVLERAVVVENE